MTGMPAQFASTPKGLANLIDQLEPLTKQLLEAANQRERPRFVELFTLHEGYTHQLLQRLEAGERDKLSPEQRDALKRVLVLRLEVQTQIASWADQVKHELRALSQSSKLNRQYKS